jgi:hypothetical protein
MAKDKGIILEAEAATTPDEGVDLEFNPRATPIKDDIHLVEYLAYYGCSVGKGITITLAPRKVDYTKAPEEGVYVAAQVLALGACLPLPLFARQVLAFYHLAPTQISPGSWRVILGFAALGQLHKVSLGIEEFQYIYQLKPRQQNSYCFAPWKSREKLILSVPESDIC